MGYTKKQYLIGLGGTLIIFGVFFAILEFPELSGGSQRFSEFYFGKFQEQKLQEQKLRELESSNNPMTELWCLELIPEEDRKELGYLKGDFLDELVCREDYKKAQELFGNP